MEGVTVKYVTQVTTQPKLGGIQQKCQQFCGWEGYENIYHFSFILSRNVVFLVLQEEAVKTSGCFLDGLV